MSGQSEESKQRDRKMIKDEIAALYGFIERTRNMFYVAIVGLLTSFSFLDVQAAVYVVPYLIIIPIYFVTLDYMDGINELGAYIKVFIEEPESGYESRIYAAYEYNNAPVTIFKVLRGSYHVPFLSSNLVCFGLFLVHKGVNLLDYSSIDWSTWNVVDVAVVLAFLLVWAIFTVVAQYVEKSRGYYDEMWREVKATEGMEAAKKRMRVRITTI